MDALTELFNAVFGLAVFGAAWHIHTKYRLTRMACILALIAGLITYGGPVGAWINDFLGSNAPLLLFIMVLVGLVVIVADIKGKKKGADKPALVAFFMVPVFFVGFLASLDDVGGMVGNSVERIGDNAITQLKLDR